MATRFSRLLRLAYIALLLLTALGCGEEGSSDTTDTITPERTVGEPDAQVDANLVVVDTMDADVPSALCEEGTRRI